MYLNASKRIEKRADQVASNKRDNLNGLDDGIRHRIAETAYKLYEQRGRADGYDVEDWLKAEALVSGGTE